MSINFEEERFNETIKFCYMWSKFGIGFLYFLLVWFWVFPITPSKDQLSLCSAAGLVLGFLPLPCMRTNCHFEMPLVWFWLCPLPQARTFSNLRPFCHISGLVLALSITPSKDQSFWYAAGLVWFCQSTPDNSFLPFDHTLNLNVSPFLSNFLYPVSVFEID